MRLAKSAPRFETRKDAQDGCVQCDDRTNMSVTRHRCCYVNDATSVATSTFPSATDRMGSSGQVNCIAALAVTTHEERLRAHGFKFSPVFLGQTGIPINISQNKLLPEASTQRPNGGVTQLRLPSPVVDGSVVRLYMQASSAGFPLPPAGHSLLAPAQIG